MLMVSTFQVFPPSVVVNSDESALFFESVSLNEGSAESRVIVVDLYSLSVSQKTLLWHEQLTYYVLLSRPGRNSPDIRRQCPILERAPSL